LAGINVNLIVKGGNLSALTGGGANAMMPKNNIGKELTIAEQAMKNIVSEQRNLLIKQKESELKKQFGIKDTNSGLGGVMGRLGGMLSKALGPLALIAALVKSSKSLLKMLEGIMKVLLMFLKPIGDILATFLRPIYMLFRPIAKAFNAYFRLYQKEANAAIKAGMTFQEAGMTSMAADAFMSAFTVILKPFFNLMILGFGELAKMIGDVMFIPIQLWIYGFASLLDALGFEDTANAFRMSVQTMKQSMHDLIDNGIQWYINKTDEVLFAHISDLTNAADGIKSILNILPDKTEEEKKLIMDMFKELDTKGADTLSTMKTDLNDFAKSMSKIKDPAKSAASSIDTLRKSIEKLKESLDTPIKSNVNNSNIPKAPINYDLKLPKSQIDYSYLMTNGGYMGP